MADLIELRFLHSLFWSEREIAALPVLTALALVRAGALAFRRRYPIAVSLIVSATMITIPTNGLSHVFSSYWPALTPSLHGDPGWWPQAFGYTAALEAFITVYTVAALRDRGRAIAVAGWHMACLAPWFIPQIITWGPGPALISSLILGISTYLGGVHRRIVAVLSQIEARRDRIESGRRQGALDAARMERERISSELQRLVAEHLRRMVDQAKRARAEVEASGATAKAREAMVAIERTGRAALGDARRALGLLREEFAPATSTVADSTGFGMHLAGPAAAIDTLTNENRDASSRVDLAFSFFLFAYFISEIGGSQALPPWRALRVISHPADIVAILLITLPLAFRRRIPFLASLLVACGFALHALAGHFFGLAAILGLLAGVYSVWAARDLPQGLISFGAAALVVPLAEEQLAAVFQLGLVTIYLPFLPGACFLGWQERRLGKALEVQRRQENELKLLAEEERERARTEERLRIARELHDVTAHSLSVMTIQAGAARTVAAKAPAQAHRALMTIEETGRRARGEIDGLFSETFEAMEGPPLGIDALPALVEEMREAGLDVEVDLSSPREPLPRGLDISLYRVVQEALTNAVKHAGRTRVRVRVECVASSISVEVVDEGATPPDARRPHSSLDHRGGRGLIGIQERVKAYGGTMNAGNRGRGFSVQVTVPIKQDEIDPVGSQPT